MKNILGHRSWSKQEIIDFLIRSRTFTMCTLPHYRYRRVRQICRELESKGWIEKSGEDETCINWRSTAKFIHDNGLDLV